MSDYKNRIIVALDFQTKEEVVSLVEASQGELQYAKVGMELFYSLGADIINYLKDQGLKVFLDLKVHDIPNTAAGALKSLSKLEVDMVNVHASGGIKMMQAAKEALSQADSKPLIIGVTQLTSTDQDMLNNELNISGSTQDAVINLAKNAKTAGLDGVVASPLEVSNIKETCGKDFITVTPGIRLAGNSQDDQKRITTPAEAFRNGSDYIVIGRPITQSSDPKGVLIAINDCIAV